MAKRVERGGPVLAESGGKPVRAGSGAARGLQHVGDAEVEPARAFAARGGDQPEDLAVEEGAGGNAGVAQEAFQATVGGTLDLAPLAFDDQELPRGFGVVVSSFCANGERRSHDFASIGPRHFEFRRDGCVAGAGVAAWHESPTEHGPGEGSEVAFLANAPSVQPLRAFGVPAIEHDAGLHQRRGRDDQARGLDEADPLQVGGDVRVGSRHRQLVSGHR